MELFTKVWCSDADAVPHSQREVQVRVQALYHKADKG
jgi:hypothetical protein